MSAPGRRLWIDSHIHIRGWSEEGGPRDFPVEAILAVLDAEPAGLVWVISLGFPEMARLRADPVAAVPWVNEGQWRLLQEAPPGRLFGSLSVHPRALRESHAALDLYGGERGFVQVGEILSHDWGCALDDPGLVELARHAADLGLPLQCHCSTSAVPDGEHIRQTISLARQVPQAQVIAAHAIGGSNSYLHITAAEIYRTLGHDNLWLEIRDFHTREYLRAALQRLGAERLLVGTDWIARKQPPFPPYGLLFSETDVDRNPYPCCVASLEGFLRESGATDEEVDCIASANALRLFRLADRLG